MKGVRVCRLDHTLWMWIWPVHNWMRQYFNLYHHEINPPLPLRSGGVEQFGAHSLWKPKSRLDCSCLVLTMVIRSAKEVGIIFLGLRYCKCWFAFTCCNKSVRSSLTVLPNGGPGLFFPSSLCFQIRLRTLSVLTPVIRTVSVLLKPTSKDSVTGSVKLIHT